MLELFLEDITQRIANSYIRIWHEYNSSNVTYLNSFIDETYNRSYQQENIFYINEKYRFFN